MYDKRYVCINVIRLKYALARSLARHIHFPLAKRSIIHLRPISFNGNDILTLPFDIVAAAAAAAVFSGFGSGTLWLNNAIVVFFAIGWFVLEHILLSLANYVLFRRTLFIFVSSTLLLFDSQMCSSARDPNTANNCNTHTRSHTDLYRMRNEMRIQWDSEQFWKILCHTSLYLPMLLSLR